MTILSVLCDRRLNRRQRSSRDPSAPARLRRGPSVGMTRKFTLYQEGVERRLTSSRTLNTKELFGRPGLGNFFVWRGKYLV
jgi:hypothetical protein